MTYLNFLSGSKFLLITHDFSRTGSPLLLIEIALEMKRSGCQVTIVSLASDGAKSSLAYENKIREISLSKAFEEANQADYIIANTALTGPWITQLIKVHPNAGQKIIWWIHEIDVALYSRNISGFNHVKALIFDSNASFKQWKTLNLPFPSLVKVIHPSITDEFFRRSEGTHLPFPINKYLRKLGFKPSLLDRNQIRKKLGVENDECLISLFSHYSTTKGHLLFIKAMGKLVSQLPDLRIKMIIIGFRDKKQRTEILSLLSEDERKIIDNRRFLLCQNDLTPFYKASDIFVMNSQGLGENFGRVTTEAMAFGLPILATGSGGTLEIVIDGITGLHHSISEQGQDQLMKNIVYLRKNPLKAVSMGELGRQRVKNNFSNKLFYKEFGDIILKIK